MSQKEPPKWVARLLILLVWGVVPLSWGYVLAYVGVRALLSRSLADAGRHLLRGTLPVSVRRSAWVGRLVQSQGLFSYALLEVLFSLYYRHLASRAQAPTVSHTASREYIVRTIVTAIQDGMGDKDKGGGPVWAVQSDPNRLPLVKRTLDYNDPRAVAFRKEMSGWFLGVSEDQITKQDIQNWLSWALFGKFYWQLTEEEARDTDDSAQPRLAFLDDATKLYAARGGLTSFPEHVTLSTEQERSRRTMLLSLDPVHVSARPFAFYACIALMNTTLLTYWRWTFGLERKKIGDTHYLVYIPRGWRVEAAKSGKAPLPVLFLHGLGIGMAEYVHVVQSMLDPHCSPHPRPVLIPLQPWTSAGLFSPRFMRPWKAEESVTFIKTMLQRHGFEECGVSVLSHSMGTILHAWLLKAAPQLVRRSIFVDPVCFQLWAPHLCYRFLYKRPETFVEYSLRYFVAREVATAHVLTRYFDWSTSVLFVQDIPHADDPHRTRVYLAGADTVVDAPGLRRYLCRNGMEQVVEYREGLHHGAYIMGPSHASRRILQELDEPMEGGV